MNLKINGREVEFQPGQTILEAARQAGIEIPTLCHLEGAPATGACRICVVEVTGSDRLLPSCETPAQEGMEVWTDRARVIQARKAILEMLVASGQHNCFVSESDPDEWTQFQLEAMEAGGHGEICPAHGDCRLQDLVVAYGVRPENLKPAQGPFPVDDGHPLIQRDFSRCIQCGRCVSACNEVQVNLAIPNPFGRREEHSDEQGWFPVADYDHCVFCGECVQACPVGALTEKKAVNKGRHWEAEKTKTTCPYCGVGCQMYLHVQDGKVVKVTGADNIPNQGSLCVKGRFGLRLHRLRGPADLAPDQGGGPVRKGLLGRGVGPGGQALQGDQGGARPQQPGRADLGPGDQRGQLPHAEAGPGRVRNK